MCPILSSRLAAYRSAQRGCQAIRSATRDSFSPIAARAVSYDAIKSPQWLRRNKHRATINTGIAAIIELFGRSSSASPAIASVLSTF
jgi:hypothetical protein